jgi:uncharacterized protein YfaS (alpha-2-macroglobulin family)
MLALARAAVAAATFVLFTVTSFAAEKAFQRPELDDAAIKLEAQIKADAGQVTKAPAVLRREIDTAFTRNDFRTGMQLLSQLISVAPQDSAAWLRLAKAVLQVRPGNDQERTLLLERAATAAYIAYQRSASSTEEAEALVVVGRTYADRSLWRPALDALRISLELSEVANVRQQYERMRAEYGFRLLDYSVDSDAVSPRACFQFSEELAKRVDFSPFVVVAGQDKPALSAQERQLCVEGLKHGEHYAVTLRPGIPSAVKETLAKTAELNIYVRDRTPAVRFTGKAYVLPRTGQHGIPLVSINTSSVSIEVYRIGDRSLVDTVLGRDFQSTLDRYDVERLANRRGGLVWKGEMSVERMLNADVTTAFPVEQAVGTLMPGVYVMVAEATGAPREEYASLATQWFIVSDLGLTAFSGNDGVHVLVHSLESAQPKGGIEVRLLSRGNEVLATRRTDADGHVQFEANLARGEGALSPAMLVAADGNSDYAFLNLKGPAFDLTDRGVGGRLAPAGLDAFVYTERGVYRSGETVQVAALLRDPQGVAALNVPLTLVVERPDGVEYRRAVLKDEGLGGRTLSLALVSSAPTGTWYVRAYADPKRPPVGEARFLVEDYVPDRIEFDLGTNAKSISKSSPAEITVDGRYLYGAPAAKLDLEGEMVVAPAKERAGFVGYQFGTADEEVETVRKPLEGLPQTDQNGKARLSVSILKQPVTTRPLEAQVIVRMAETGGRAVERKLSLPVLAAGPMIGIKPLFSGRSLGEGESASFDVVLASPEGTAIAGKPLRYELLKRETRYQWYRREGTWEFEPVQSTKRIGDGTITTAADKPARISLPVQWGRYRLEVSSTDRDGPVSSVEFDAGWYAETSADTPDMLEVGLDKPEYAAGDTMNVTVTARTAGKITVHVIGDRLVSTVTQDVIQGTARLPIKVGSDWGSGAYVVATLRRPLDAKAERMPGRALGVQWFSINRKGRTLAVNLQLPDLIRPNSALRIPVRLAGLAPGDEARIAIAAVDVGILNLTGYKPPAPDEYFYGKRQLSAEIRDLYGQLIDGMQGVRGAIKTGGDAGAELQGSPPTQKPLALFSGIVTVGADGTAEVAFDIPDFSGTARVMAVAWSKDKVGRASGDVTIRDPVVLTATLPRFLLHGDHGTMHLNIDNVEGAAGDYRVELRNEGVNVLGNYTPATVRLSEKQRSSLAIPLNASGSGTADLTVRMSGPGNVVIERQYALAVKPGTQVLARRTVKPLGPGESLTLSPDLFADLVPGSGKIALSVGVSGALDAAALLAALDRYPFGCSEQIASRALPLLYVNDLASAAHLALDGAVDQRVRDSIERLLARQGSNGSFGLWAPGGEDTWLDAYVTDFLTRARERNFAVPETGFKLALEHLRNFLATAPEPSKDGGGNLAYVLYVLARNGAAPIGDLRYYADARLNDFATPFAKAQLAGALDMLGDRARAERVFAAALVALEPAPASASGRTDYGSILRDAAALVTLASEGGASRTTITAAITRVETARGSASHTSTQENAWMVLAARALMKDAQAIAIQIGDEKVTGAVNRTLRQSELPAPLKVTNAGDGTVQAVVTVSGAPLLPEPAAEKGFRVERKYYTLAGKPADPAKARQNDRFAVVLKITEPTPQFGRIIVADYLPAGFEIDNPRLVSSGDTGTLSWIEDAQEPVHVEFRDDHFGAAFNRKTEDAAVFTVAYVVRAVSPGRYVHPQAYVEDMYRPDRFGRTNTATIEVSPSK